jgi:cell division protein FtsI (penicillin-binding protein 3)
MSDNLKQTILRFALIFIGILVMFIVVLAQIVYIQTVEKDEWEKASQQNRTKITRVLPATRGNIYDCNNQLLASSMPEYTIHMDTRVEALHLGGDTLFHQYVDSMAEGFSRIIGDKTAAEYKHIMTRAFYGKTNRERNIRLTNTRISYTQRKELMELPLVRRGVYKSGISFIDRNIRSKPFGSLGSRTIGNIYGDGGAGNAGIEKRFDQYLRGVDGTSRRDRVAGHWEYIPIAEAENGADVYTTLDANLLDICESNLRKQLQINQAEWGCVVLMEVQTGAIKAMCNLKMGEDGQYYESQNYAVTRMEPGSTFKTLALMAALDDRKVDFNDSIEVWKAGWKYYGSNHMDAHPADTTYSIRQALAVSSNIALARIVTDGYDGSAKKFVQKLKRMGVCDSVDYIIPGADQGKIDIPNDTVTISKMAYGYSVELSPLQMAMLYNGIANNGKLITPVLVTKVQKEDDVLEEFESEVIRNSICSDRTLEEIQACLHDVVWDNDLGTASVYKWKGHIAKYKAQSKIVAIAGKTGTAQVLENGKYNSHKHRMSFVGYFPEDAPQYTCICVIHAPRNKGYYDAGMDCGSVVRNIAEKTMAYSNEYVIDGKELVFRKRQ